MATNNTYGYRLFLNSANNDTDLSRDNSDNAYTSSNIPVIETLPTLAGGYNENTFITNTWGYKKDSSNYFPYVPGTTLLESSTSTSGDTTTLEFAAKIDYDQPAGSYNLALGLNAVAKVVTRSLTITFAGTGVDSVKVCSTSGNCTGDQLLGTVTTSGDSVTGLLSNTAYYLYPIFTSGYELDSWTNTGTYGTLDTTTATNPTFTTANGDGAVTITGKAKLYFQNATLSNCGSTMYDNRGTDAYKNIAYTTASITAGGTTLCWMTRNLDLPGGTTITSQDSNVTTDYTLPTSSVTGFSDDNTAYVYNSNSTACGENSPCYSYYSGVAALAGANSRTGEAPSDICPKGWRLPTSTELTALKNTYTTGATLTATPFLANYAGYYYYSAFYEGSTYGTYWSGTSTSLRSGYRLGLNADTTYTSSDGKMVGRSVRCVMETRTIQEKLQAGALTMQNIGTLSASAKTNLLSQMSDGVSYNSADIRDNKQYTIAKIGGKVWMTKNLDLNGGTTLTPASSNVSANYTLPSSSTTGFSSDTDAYVYNSGSTTCASNTPCYSYYSYIAATAGSNPSAGEAMSDICPKGWKLPAQSEYNTLISTYTTGALLADQPFLGVYSGYYDDSAFHAGGSDGFFWISVATGASYARRMHSYSGANISQSYKRNGFSVRCILDTRSIDELVNMQDITAEVIENTASGATATLTDVRDSKTYTVGKINNQIWMTKNLDLAGGTALYSDTSNVPAGYPSSGGTAFYTLPASSTSGFSDDSAANVYNSGSTTCASGSPCYSYYTYAAATAGTNPASSNAVSDICPAGWRLPTYAELNALQNAYTGTNALAGSPFLGVYSGYYGYSAFDAGGSRGYYWSSTIINDTRAYRLRIYYNTDNLLGGDSRRYGFPVRCVADSE